MNKYRIIILSVVTIITLITVAWCFARPYRVWGDCMEPAVKDGQLRFSNQVLPYLRQYQIGDIVIFNYENKVWISRIVGLETDTIQIVEGNIIVNGVPLQDNGIDRNWFGWNYGSYGIEKPFQIPIDHVYVLSDNLSAHHDDSRVFGPISKKAILGIVW